MTSAMSWICNKGLFTTGILACNASVIFNTKTKTLTMYTDKYGNVHYYQLLPVCSDYHLHKIDAVRFWLNMKWCHRLSSAYTMSSTKK